MGERAGPARVLLAATGSGIGGTEKIVRLIAGSLDRRRFLPVVLSLRPAGETAEAIRRSGVEVVSFGFTPRSPAAILPAAAMVPRLAREIRARRIRLVHSFLFLANMVGRFACRLTGVPGISSIRVEEREKGYHLWAERMTRSLADHYLTPSQRVADFTSLRAGVPRERITVIPNPVIPPPPASGRLQAMLGLEPGVSPAAFVGRLHRQKGVDLLLEAWAALPPSRPLLLVVGDGPERPSLEERARRPDLAGSVRFTGWIPGVGDLLADLSLLVLPSRWEGQPNVILEAMAAGTPVVAAATGGVPELVSPGETGTLIPPGDARALGEALAAILAEPGRARAMARRAGEEVRRRHDPLLFLERVQGLYDKMLAGT
jgi:glycosyltransferase involved in cell wall biosynthesis